MLPDFTQGFRAGLDSGQPPPGMTATDPAETPRRFAVYRNNVAQGLSRALAARFPVVGRLLGDEYFRALAAVYTQAEPPASPVLLEWGGGFPRFLAGFPPLAGLPFLPDVARLEWLRGLAYHAADAPPADAATLQDALTGKARLGLHPSVRVLRSAHAVVTIWQENQPGRTPGAIDDRPEIALVLRDGADRVPVLPLSAADAVFLQVLMRDGNLPAAALAARHEGPLQDAPLPDTPRHHDPAALLALLLRHGALTKA